MYKFNILFFIAVFFSCTVVHAQKGKPQKIDSIYVHLYTDSLKKGTYNYINIDGLLSNGKYLPLDSNQVSFKCSHGQFFGNNLWIEPDCKEEKITITAALKSNHQLRKEFVMYVKKKEDGPLKTEQQVLDEMKTQGKKKKGK